MRRMLIASMLLAWTVPALAEVVDFKPADNWVSAPDDGSGGPLVLIWAHPRGLGQSGTQFFSPVEVSTSVFSVIPDELPSLQVTAIPEPSAFAWIFSALAIYGIAGLRKKASAGESNHAIG